MAGERGVTGASVPMNVTFDTNCLIDLEERGPGAQHLRRIVEQASAGAVNLRTVAISASERKRDGTYAASFSEFRAKLSDVGLHEFEILPPFAIWGVTYWDHCTWGSEELSAQADRIHRVLFPETPYRYREYCEAMGVDPDDGATNRKWRNRVCDTLALWTHLHFGGGIFVTSDENFHKPTKKAALAELGAELILRPGAMADWCAPS